MDKENYDKTLVVKRCFLNKFLLQKSFEEGDRKNACQNGFNAEFNYLQNFLDGIGIRLMVR